MQFAVDPATGRQVVIEMNPRVSRSSALASKATGFPIAKIAAKLAVGYTLDEIPNDITARPTPASFEPAIDYVVTKIPRWAFEKLPGTTRRPRHADAVGRRGDGDRPHVPREPAEGAALARAGPARAELRPGRGAARDACPTTTSLAAVGIATPDRIFQVGELLRRGVDDRRRSTPPRKIDPWFLDQISMIVEERHALAGEQPSTMTPQGLAARQAARLLRRASSPTCGAPTRPTCAPPARRPA